MKSEDDARIRLLTHVQSSGRRGASQVSAARELGMSDAGLSRLCDELGQSGVIQRLPHPHDRRIKMLHLTPEGEQQVQACAGSFETNIANFVQTLTTEEQALLSRLVARATGVPVETNTCAGCRVGAVDATPAGPDIMPQTMPVSENPSTPAGPAGSGDAGAL